MPIIRCRRRAGSRRRRKSPIGFWIRSSSRRRGTRWDCKKLDMSNEKKRGKLGILVGGGPAPGINGVISAATIEGINQKYEVVGFRDGYKWLAQGDPEHCFRLTIDSVK